MNDLCLETSAVIIRPASGMDLHVSMTNNARSVYISDDAVHDGARRLLFHAYGILMKPAVRYCTDL